MKILARNKKANFDYQITDRMVAGIALAGPEVKSAKLAQVSLKGSFITIQSGEAFLVNAHFTPYKMSAANPEPTRPRKLLLHRREIDQLTTAKQSGLAAVPLALGVQRGLVKVEIGIGRGKKRYDKRETIKKRAQQREIERQVKS